MKSPFQNAILQQIYISMLIIREVFAFLSFLWKTVQEVLLVRHAEHVKLFFFYVQIGMSLLGNKTLAIIFIVVHDYLSCIHFYTVKSCWFLTHSLSILIATVQLIKYLDVVSSLPLWGGSGEEDTPGLSPGSLTGIQTSVDKQEIFCQKTHLINEISSFPPS